MPAENVYGAELTERNGRFTGFLSSAIPIGDTKVGLLKGSVAAAAPATVGFGDHPTDVPFLEACVRSEVNSELNFCPNFEGLVLGCIDADFCK